MEHNKKSLLVIGSYPSTQEGEEILKTALAPLRDHFDILLATHCPTSKDIQSLIQYYVYDYKNDIVSFKNAVYFWADYPQFYFQLHQNKSNAYGVYRQLMNAVHLMEDYYDDFIYMEGDCLLSDVDVLKLKAFPEICKSNKKDALYFKYPGFLASLVFYSKMSFFKETFYFAKSMDEYEKHCDAIGSYGILENFMFKSVENKNAFDKIHSIEIEISDYFDTSKLSVNAFANGKVLIDRSYCLDVVRLKNSDKPLALCYLTSESKQFEEPTSVYLDGDLITVLPTGKHGTVVPIDPKNEIFCIKFSNGHSYVFDKRSILSENNKDFATLK